MIKLKLKVGRNVHHVDVWQAKYNDEGSVSLYTSLNERNVFKVARGNTVTFETDDPDDISDDIKIYSVGDMKNLCEEVQARMYWDIRSNYDSIITFSQVKEICQPAFGINALSLDERHNYIYSRGANSLTDKMYHSATDETGIIRSLTIGPRNVVLVGGFEGMPVKYLNERALHEFANIINNYFPE